MVASVWATFCGNLATFVPTSGHTGIANHNDIWNEKFAMSIKRNIYGVDCQRGGD